MEVKQGVEAAHAPLVGSDCSDVEIHRTERARIDSRLFQALDCIGTFGGYATFFYFSDFFRLSGLGFRL